MSAGPIACGEQKSALDWWRLSLFNLRALLRDPSFLNLSAVREWPRAPLFMWQSGVTSHLDRNILEISRKRSADACEHRRLFGSADRSSPMRGRSAERILSAEKPARLGRADDKRLISTYAMDWGVRLPPPAADAASVWSISGSRSICSRRSRCDAAGRRLVRLRTWCLSKRLRLARVVLLGRGQSALAGVVLVAPASRRK